MPGSTPDQEELEMTTLVVGASGATGRLLVEQLLDRGEHVRIIVRSIVALFQKITGNNNVSIIQASILDLTDDEMAAISTIAKSLYEAVATEVKRGTDLYWAIHQSMISKTRP